MERETLLREIDAQILAFSRAVNGAPKEEIPGLLECIADLQNFMFTVQGAADADIPALAAEWEREMESAPHPSPLPAREREQSPPLPSREYPYG